MLRRPSPFPARRACVRRGARQAALALRTVVATLPVDFGRLSIAAEIAVTADGRFLYVSIFDHDSLAAFARSAICLSTGRFAPSGDSLVRVPPPSRILFL